MFKAIDHLAIIKNTTEGEAAEPESLAPIAGRATKDKDQEVVSDVPLSFAESKQLPAMTAPKFEASFKSVATRAESGGEQESREQATDALLSEEVFLEWLFAAYP